MQATPVIHVKSSVFKNVRQGCRHRQGVVQVLLVCPGGLPPWLPQHHAERVPGRECWRRGERTMWRCVHRAPALPGGCANGCATMQGERGEEKHCLGAAWVECRRDLGPCIVTAVKTSWPPRDGLKEAAPGVYHSTLRTNLSLIFVVRRGRDGKLFSRISLPVCRSSQVVQRVCVADSVPAGQPSRPGGSLAVRGRTVTEGNKTHFQSVPVAAVAAALRQPFGVSITPPRGCFRPARNYFMMTSIP